VTSPESVVLRNLELEQFRVYESLSLEVPDAGLRIIGANGTGKSSLLEAIELISTTRPRRGALDSDLIAHGSGVDLGVPPYARVDASVWRSDALVQIGVFIQRYEHRSGTKKVLKVADRSRRAGDVVGLVPTVTFSPDDLDLVLGSPSVRRRFLDILLSQTDRRYLAHLSRYARILTQRNSLLKDVAASTIDASDQFSYWDEQIIGLGSYILAARVRAIRALAVLATESFGHLSPTSGLFQISYSSTLDAADGWWESLADESSDVMDAAQRVAVLYERQLTKGRSADIARGSTLIGPHRDDIAMELNARVLSRFGSRGQQRLAVMAMKIAELSRAKSVIGFRPILLLDDILSELDPNHRDTLLATVVRGGQAFITATEESLVERNELRDLAAVRLTGVGQLEH